MDEMRQIATIELKDKEDTFVLSYLLGVLRMHGMKLILPSNGKLNIVVPQSKYEEIHLDY